MVEVVDSLRPALVPLIAIIAALLISITGEKHRNIREAWSLIASIIMFAIVLTMLPTILSGRVIEFAPNIFNIAKGISFVFRVDALGMFFVFLSTGLWIVTNFYSIGYMRHLNEPYQTRYFFAFAMCLAGATGVALAGNLVTLFLFYEFLSLGAYPLVIHSETDEAMKSGRKYLLYVLFGGALVLGGMAMTYSLTGTLTLSQTGILAGTASPAVLTLLFFVFIFGFGVKAGVMPFHAWLPAAMVAPTPVSGLLHAVAVVKAGAFGISRVVYNVYGVDLVKDLGLAYPLAIIASITILAGSIIALKQTNLKLRLAYSTISQLSYIVLGAGLASFISPTAAIGGIVHIANQAVMKLTLFFVAGAIYVHTGKKYIYEMNGIGKKMPITMACFALGAIGMVGAPPTAGFITKWFLASGALEGGQLLFVVVLLGSALLNAGYFFPIIYNAFLKEPDDGEKSFDEAPLIMLAPIVLLAILILILGIFPNAPYTPLRIAQVAASQFVAGGG